MRILVAGATGVVGQPLIDHLIYYGHDVYGITHSAERAQDLASRGAKPLLIDIFDQEVVNQTFSKVLPEVVIDMLTALPKTYTPDSMKKAAHEDHKLRTVGGGNLQTAAEVSGTSRYMVQSSAFLYEQGTGLANEETPFALKAPNGVKENAHLYHDIERRVLQSTKIQGVALRFGFFYGPRTWFHADGDMVHQVKHQQFPIIGSGDGIWNFIHVEDAAKAIASALYCTPGAYNIVNDSPSPLKVWLTGFALYYQAPPPKMIPLEEAQKTFDPSSIYYATKLRGASNMKARRELNFEPRSLEWLI